MNFHIDVYMEGLEQYAGLNSNFLIGNIGRRLIATLILVRIAVIYDPKLECRSAIVYGGIHTYNPDHLDI